MVQQQTQRARKGPAKLERLEARITREQKRIIERAAGLRGTTVTEFVVVSAQQAAANAIKDFEMMSLHGEAREAFVQALLNPPTPNAPSKKAAERYRQLSGR
jgi:uncharacterized protein (DUF1778 family)